MGMRGVVIMPKTKREVVADRERRMSRFVDGEGVWIPESFAMQNESMVHEGGVPQMMDVVDEVVEPVEDVPDLSERSFVFPAQTVLGDPLTPIHDSPSSFAPSPSSPPIQPIPIGRPLPPVRADSAPTIDQATIPRRPVDRAHCP